MYFDFFHSKVHSGVLLFFYVLLYPRLLNGPGRATGRTMESSEAVIVCYLKE